MPPPAFSDLGKPANDLINKDFYHGNASIFEVKLKSPDGLSITTKGTSPHEGHIAASVEAKKAIQKGEDPISSPSVRKSAQGTSIKFQGLRLQFPKIRFQTIPLEISVNLDHRPVRIPVFSEIEPDDYEDDMRGSDGASGQRQTQMQTVSLGFQRPDTLRAPNALVDLQTPSIVTASAPVSPPRQRPDVFKMNTNAAIDAKLKLKSLGITATGTWTSHSHLTTKIELEDILAAGVKAEYQGAFHPQSGLKGQRASLFFKQGAFFTRAFADFTPSTGNVHTTVDGVVAHEGFLVGGEAGFDVQKAALTRYAAAFAYATPSYSMAVLATNNLSVYHASLYQRVNPFTEVGVKTGYDTKSNQSTGIEIATKYKIDPTAFAKVKVNDRGIISLAYNAKINAGLTFGIGASLDAQKLNEAGHKIGTSFVFEG